MNKSRVLLLVLAAFTIAFFSACGKYKKPAKGDFGRILVVMDSTKLDSQTAQALRESFGGTIETLPAPEPQFHLHFTDLKRNSDLDWIKTRKNVIVVATLDDETNVGSYMRSLLSDELRQRVETNQNFAFPLKDHWATNQWVLLLSGTDDATLAENIREASGSLIDNVLDIEYVRWHKQLYRRKEQVKLADSLWDKHGWKIRIQADYKKHIDSLNMVTFRRSAPDNQRWFWIWWKDNVNDISYLDADWINATRDSLLQTYYKGARNDANLAFRGVKGDSYIETEYRRPVITSTKIMNGKYTLETKGTWRMTQDFMGGPFVNYAVYDENQRRLYLMEFGQFAPKYNKRRFVRQFEATARTFATDSSFTISAR